MTISPADGDHGLKLDERAGLQEIERRQDREGDDPHAVRQLGIGEKGRRQRHADEIGRQHRLAAGDGRQAAKPEQHQGNELRLGLAHPMADLREEPGREARQQPQRRRR